MIGGCTGRTSSGFVLGLPTLRFRLAVQVLNRFDRELKIEHVLTVLLVAHVLNTEFDRHMRAFV